MALDTSGIRDLCVGCSSAVWENNRFKECRKGYRPKQYPDREKGQNFKTIGCDGKGKQKAKAEDEEEEEKKARRCEYVAKLLGVNLKPYEIE